MSSPIMPDPSNLAPSSLVGAAAQEAVKPVSSLVEALIGPKVERVRRWAKERDLQARLDDPRLHEAFDNYAHRISERVSEFTTLVFRNAALPLSVGYEPLTLRARGNQNEVHESLLTGEGARSVIIDGAGMGKSTFVQHLVAQALASNDLVPILFELRRIGENVPLQEALAREFDDVDCPFERNLLFRLFAIGRFLFVLDGYDEVPEERRTALAHEIEMLAISATQSAVILTSRPETPLPGIPGARILEFRPLTNEQAASLVRRYDRAGGGLDIGERLIREFPDVPEHFLETPLLVSLLYMTFGYHGSVSTRVSTFYDELYGALYKGHDLTKAGWVRPKQSGLDVEDFRRLLRSFAFLLISHHRSSFASYSAAVGVADDATRLAMVRPTSPSAFVDDLLSAVPLLVRDGLEFRFLHKSVIEFFAAEFLASDMRGEKLIAQIRGSTRRMSFAPSLDFIADLNPPLFRRAVAAPIAELALRHRTDEPNPLVRSITFLADVRVSLWHAEEELHSHVEQSLGQLEARARWDSGILSIPLGSESTDPPLVVLVANMATRGEVVTASTYALLTDRVEVTPLDLWYYASGGVELPFKTWVRLGEDWSRDFVAQEGVQHALELLLHVAQQVKLVAGPLKGLHVLSPSRATELLELVRSEATTHEWLSAIITGHIETNGV